MSENEFFKHVIDNIHEGAEVINIWPLFNTGTYMTWQQGHQPTNQYVCKFKFSYGDK